jgi:carbon monoxide dehydrogenase subunit G
MAEFTVRTSSAATVHAERRAVWRALTDPDLLPRLTPYLRRIEVDGDRWTWHLVRMPVLGAVVTPTFTEVMTLEEPSSIGFEHDPQRPEERAGVAGAYHLPEHGSGTGLRVDLAITVDLPFPRAAGPAVRTAMKGVVATMGHRFSSNLVRHLDG